MRLQDWLTANEMNDGQFAALVAVDRSTVSKLKRGKHNASLDLMSRVAKATGGAVTPNDLYAELESFSPAPSEAVA